MVDETPFLKLFDTLSGLTDLELILLKVHLLIEEELTDAIMKKVESPAYLLNARLTFSNKASLARAHYDKQVKPWVWGSITKLNNIRNRLAHRLTNEEIVSEMDSFVELVQNNQPYRVTEGIKLEHPEFFWVSYLVCLAIHEAASNSNA